ncbi:MAG: hypothetical protein LBG90_09095, partial [Spirochaetaceae bacterium]|nr:hypothetical protein [Spirochaetaceae bacterium]
MSDIYLNAITPTFYEPGGIDYAKNVILYRKIAYGTIYIIPYTSFNADGTISDTGPFWLGFMNADGKICQQNGRQAILQTGYYHFFVSRESISDARIVIRRNMCSAAIAITEGQNQAVYLPFFPEIQTLIDGRTVKGKMREPGIALLKRFENPPIKNGMIGLHTPGDGTVTYGYGYVVFNEQDESNREKKKKAKEKLPELRRTGDYPDMTL